MPSSDSTNHTSRNLCVIIEEWLRAQGFALKVCHEELPLSGRAWCEVYAEDAAANQFAVAFVEADNVLILGEDQYSMQRVFAYDKQLFEKLAEALSFARP